MKKINSCDGLYGNSLDVRFTKACDNACPFCIERNGIGTCGHGTDVDMLTEMTFASGKTSVLILGGEPLLEMEKAYRYVYALRHRFESKIREIYLTTSLPYTIISGKKTFDRLMPMLTGLNVSLEHYDWSENNRLMNASSDHNRINLLRYICGNPDWALKTRVSLNLSKQGIHTASEINRFLSEMERIGVQQVKINELQHAEDMYVSFEDAYGLKLPSPYSNGCQTQINLPGHEALEITLKRSCFIVEKSRKATLQDLCKVIYKRTHKATPARNNVLYENGTLQDKWLDNNETEK